MSLPTIAIVGRPNVGKSTLFNRIMGRHTALVHEIAGVTRDRHYGEAEWLGHPFRLIDTGGLMGGKTAGLMQAIRLQTEYAIAEAACIFFVLDAREGVTAADQEIASQLHKAGKIVMLIANKVDTAEHEVADAAFYHLGFGEPYAISAEHGRGIGEVLDAIVTKFPKAHNSQGPQQGAQVAIVGRPNVGKSSLINCLLGEDRLLVDAGPGTTRDAIDSHLRCHNKVYTLVDTAGMRKPRRIGEALEKATVAVTLNRIRRCQVAVLMLDALAGIGEQDVRIGTYIVRHGKACVIAINKWDALAKHARTYETFVHLIHEAMPFLAHAPVISLSALSGKRVPELFSHIDAVLEESKRRVPAAKLNALVKTITRQRPAPTYRGRGVTFSFCVQTRIQPPTFLCFVNHPEGIAPHYQRYIENQLRRRFGFAGTPIRFYYRKK